MELGHLMLRCKGAPKGAASLLLQTRSSSYSKHNPVERLKPEPAFVTATKRNPVPQCYKAMEFRKKVAVCDRGGSLSYGDLLARSLDLAHSIHDALGPHQPAQHVALLTPNASSLLVSKWAIWLSGHAAVPLNPDWSSAALEHAVRDSNCGLILAHESVIDRVFDIAARAGTKLMCVDRTWTEKRKDDEEMPKFIHEKELFERHQSQPALVLYNRERGAFTSSRFTHAQLNAGAAGMASTWDLTEKSSVLHALPMDHPFAVVSCTMAPLSVGGKVVLHPKFDTIKIWSHLLGIPVRQTDPLPKINLFPSLPSHFHQLLDRYRQLFTTPKTKDYVRSTLKKRVRLMAHVGGPLAKDFRKQWKAISGHEILSCYSTLNAGSVLSAQPGAEDTHLLQAVPGIQTRVVKYSPDGKPIVQDENCRSRSACIGELLVKGDQVGQEGWAPTGETVKMAKGKFEILGKRK